jgi:hypothetical protein
LAEILTLTDEMWERDEMWEDASRCGYSFQTGEISEKDISAVAQRRSYIYAFLAANVLYAVIAATIGGGALVYIASLVVCECVCYAVIKERLRKGSKKG